MKKLFYLLLVILVNTNLISQENFYDINSIREIKIYFEESNWDHILDSLFQDGYGSGRLIGSVAIDGAVYDSVGIRYKGYSSWNIDSIKNPFNIKLDYIIDGQAHMGYRKIKLSNVIHDPSFVREALSYQIARKYMPVSQANYANVYVNDTLIGLYTNVESVGKDFASANFGSSENAFFKGSPENLEIPFGQNANLSNIHGTDTTSYYPYYDIKSDYGWTELYKLIRILNEVPDSIESILNVDRTLWMHSFNYSLLNLDSYIGYSQNYYIYQDNNGRFNPILWDLNMSFGSFRLTDGIIPSQLPLSYLQTLDPLQHATSTSRPLISSLMQNDTYKRMYIAHIRTIIEENFANNDFIQAGEAMRNIIDTDVQNDPNRFYSYQNFNDNFDTTITNGSLTYPGIVSLMNARANFLSTYQGYENAPEITNIDYSPTNISAGTEVWITAEIDSADSIFLAYRYNNWDVFTKISMFDDGNHNDGASGDNIYGTSVVFNSDFQYYIYAENSEAGMFSPERAEYEFYTISESLGNSLVINEIMASNAYTQADEYGEYNDWIELYNNTNNDISLDGFFLSDDEMELTKWTFPDTTILAKNYIIIWADKDTVQNGLHANFKLSAIGESVYLSDNSSTLLNQVIFPQQTTDMAYARVPNGTGSFVIQEATFSANNDSLNSVNEISYINFNIYPNPFNNSITIETEYSFNEPITIYNITGQIIYRNELKNNIYRLNTSEWEKGMYFIKIGETTKKIVKY